MTQTSFYQNLPGVREFSELTHFDAYRNVPEDWLIVAADVVDSTQAIEKGKYKEVNALGVCVITAILNIYPEIKIPFVFGGDGASLCIPPVMRATAEKALLFCQQMAEELYDLSLRVGFIPVCDVATAGFDVKVMKYQISKYWDQALFTGGGLAYADECLKNPSLHYALKPSEQKSEADFSGFECRWKNIPSRHGETVALLIKVIDQADVESLYDGILKKITSVYGNTEQSHPLQESLIDFTINPLKMSVERESRTYRQSLKEKISYAFKIWLECLIGKVVIGFKITTGDLAWGDYKKQTVLNTDYRKFDDMLRFVLSGSEEQRAKLTAYLDELSATKQIVYGFHVSTSTLITCMIRDRGGEHYHFVDGADGGYALAAKMLKEKLNQ